MKATNKTPACAGYLMAEALVYIGVVVVLLGAAYLAMERCINNSIALRRSADDFARVVHVGERWRADVRAATELRWGAENGVPVLSLKGSRFETAYLLTQTNLFRRFGNGPWVPTLANTRAISMEPDPHKTLTAWRCEVELEPRSRNPRFRPIFTFIAVPAAASAL